MFGVRRGIFSNAPPLWDGGSRMLGGMEWQSREDLPEKKKPAKVQAEKSRAARTRAPCFNIDDPVLRLHKVNFSWERLQSTHTPC
jgi:hypothetical protein